MKRTAVLIAACVSVLIFSQRCLIAANPCDPVDQATGTTPVIFMVGVQQFSANVSFGKADGSAFYKKHNMYVMGPMGQAINCDTLKKNCDNKFYSHYTFSADFAFYTALLTTPGGTKVSPKTVMNGAGQMVEMTEVTAADVDRYWDVVYAGYAKVGNATTSQNCHGHSFGVGDWPDCSPYGVSILLSSGTCYEGVGTRDATLAYSIGHSIKVTGKLCTVNVGSGMTTPMDILDSSSEKMQFSRVYTQSNGCNNGVNIHKAAINQGASFSLYKKKPAP